MGQPMAIVCLFGRTGRAHFAERSGLSIIKWRRRRQAPAVAACLLTPEADAAMPLLTELGNDFGGPCHYKHAAPDGAVPSTQECEMSGLKAHCP